MGWSSHCPGRINGSGYWAGSDTMISFLGFQLKTNWQLVDWPKSLIYYSSLFHISDVGSSLRYKKVWDYADITNFFISNSESGFELRWNLRAIDDDGYWSSERVSGGLLPELYSGNIDVSSRVTRNLCFQICKKFIHYICYR